MNVQQRAIRRAFGAFWMTVYGAAGSSVVWWAVWPATIQLVGWLVITLGLGVAVVLQLLRLRGHSGTRVARRSFDRDLARKIGVVIIAYTIAEGVAVLALHLLQQDAWIFPVAVGIAGVHFFVFARVLETWQYYITGALDCLAALGSTLFVSQASMTGMLRSWIFLPLLGGGVALLITALLMLYESQKISSTARAVTAIQS